MSIENNGSPNMDECIICFEKHTDKNPLHDFNTINTIIVGCKCSYKCHIDCLHSWLNQNSMCLICNKSIVSIPSILNLDVSMPKVERKIIKRTVSDIKVKAIVYIIFFIMI